MNLIRVGKIYQPFICENLMKNIKRMRHEYQNQVCYSWSLPDGTIHREDGPALEYDNGTCTGPFMWYFNGLLHKLDGPARIWSDGQTEWWFHGKEISESQYKEWIKEVGIDLDNLSEYDKNLIVMKWS